MTLAEPPSRCDLAVIGGGIVGLATARELLLRRPGLRLVVLEQEDRLARHQSAHSSGVVHAGIYYGAGSLKARLCVEGARLLREYCAERDIPFKRSGKVIVATEEAELPRLAELERLGAANGVQGLARIDGDELRGLEPHARGIAALHSPATAVVDFAEVARHLAADVASLGGQLVTGQPVTRVRAHASGVEVGDGRADLVAGFAPFCAGAWAGRLAALTGARTDVRIVPFRGAYLRLRPGRRHLVRSLIYPVPDPRLPFLGAHLTRTIDGEVLLGPTALLAGAPDAYRLARVRAWSLAGTVGFPGTWRMGRRLWRTGAAEIQTALSRHAMVARVRRYVPELRAGDAIPGHAGVRGQAIGRDGTLIDDFLLAESEGALHVLNAPSPAATAALALAGAIADRIPE